MEKQKEENQSISSHYKNAYNSCVERMVQIIDAHICRGHSAEESINSVLREVKMDILKTYFGSIKGSGE